MYNKTIVINASGYRFTIHHISDRENKHRQTIYREEMKQPLLPFFEYGELLQNGSNVLSIIHKGYEEVEEIRILQPSKYDDTRIVDSIELQIPCVKLNVEEAEISRDQINSMLLKENIDVEKIKNGVK